MERALRRRVGDKEKGGRGGGVTVLPVVEPPCWGSSPSRPLKGSPFTGGGSQDTSPVYTLPHHVLPVMSVHKIQPLCEGENTSRGKVKLISPDSWFKKTFVPAASVSLYHAVDIGGGVCA